MNDNRSSIIAAFSSSRMLILLLLGFSSGLPLALIGSGGTFQAWMTDEGISKQALGNFALVTLPFGLKFLWSPLLDRFIPPIFSSYGRRLGWVLCSQFLLMASVAVMSMVQPRDSLELLFILSCIVAFASATQDIVIDAYRTDLLSRAEVGPGVSVAIFGYRLGMIMSGAIALSAAQVVPWQTVYCSMAIVQGIGVLAVLNAPRLQDSDLRPRSLKDAVYLPLREYFNRPGAVEILLFILLYKLPDVMATMFTTRFMMDVGFAKPEIAAVVKGFGLVAVIVGSLAGGLGTARLGMRKALLLFGFLQGIAGISFAILAMVGKSYTAMVFAIGLENLCGGLGTAAFTAFLTGLCHHRFTATQYALLTSFASLLRALMGTPCGWLAENISWELYFVLSVLAALPGLALIWLRYGRWTVAASEGGRDAVV